MLIYNEWDPKYVRRMKEDLKEYSNRLIMLSIKRQIALKYRRADLYTYEIRSKICHILSGG